MLNERCAAAVRRGCELVVRGGSSRRQPGHASFFDDIAEQEPATSAAVELRAGVQHLRAALADARSTPFFGAIGVLFVVLAVALMFVAPEPVRIDREPIESKLQQLLQTSSIVLIVVASRAASRQRARLLLAPAFAGLVVGAAWFQRFDYDRVSQLVLWSDRVLSITQLTIFVGALTALFALVVRSRVLTSSWLLLAVATVGYAVSNLFDSVAFARSGDSLWVGLICLPMAGLSAFAAFFFVHAPALWQWVSADANEPSLGH